MGQNLKLRGPTGKESDAAVFLRAERGEVENTETLCTVSTFVQTLMSS